MGDRCEIVLEKSAYTPGDVINGRVECHFSQETKVTEIRVIFIGRAKVQWKQGKNTRSDVEDYFNSGANLLSCETTFPSGIYRYPFTFNLPTNLPSSAEERYGNVRYKIRAVVDRPWAFDYECKKSFVCLSYNNLSIMNGLNQPMEYTVKKIPFTWCGESKPIVLSVTLLRNGFIPNQLVVFSAKLRNYSGVRVDKICFKIIQTFEFHISSSSRTDKSTVGPEFAIADSTVFPGQETFWDLELHIPENVFIGTLQNCELIKVFCNLRGEVFLPIPHKNFKIYIPLVLGAP